MEYRKARADDYEKIFDLQNKNLVSVLSPIEKSDGFLSGSFTTEQFAALNEDLCVVVCAENEIIYGFLVASTTEFNKRFALARLMLEQYRQSFFEGRSLDSYRSYVSGPVCVAREHRGSGIFSQMYEKLFELLPPIYELAITLVAIDNSRSLSAHEKVGFQPTGQFYFNGKPFKILAREIKPKSYNS